MTYRQDMLTIILPCLNERDAIPHVLELLEDSRKALIEQTHITEVQIVVVDDGSTDGSLDLLAKYEDRIELVKNPKRLGYGGALKAGFEHIRGEYTAFLDMDYTYDPFEFIQMFQAMEREKVAMVCGDRLHEIRNMPTLRFIGNALFKGTILAVFGRKIEDSCTGQRIFRSCYIDSMQENLSDNLDFSLGMTLLFLHFRIPFREVRIQYRRRLGYSKLSVPVDGLRFYCTILLSWTDFRWRRNAILRGLRKVKISSDVG